MSIMASQISSNLAVCSQLVHTNNKGNIATLLALCEGNDFTNKKQVIWKAFPCNAIIMINDIHDQSSVKSEKVL